MVVHAALVVLLARLSGSDDVSVGTPVSGRSGPGLHDLVGMLSARSCCAPPSIRLVPSSICSAGSAATTSTRSLMRRRRSTRSSHACTANLGCTPPSVPGDARVRELRARPPRSRCRDSTFVSMKSTADKHVSISRSPFASETSLWVRRPGSTVC
ncbi:hypothetical protein GS416_08695 [Rhodococcus hoagii]|nr:hypothetical protein [Prescottella equi]